jgi:hypothetical protein
MVDALRRTMVHYGYWLKEVEHQYGMNVALEIEKEVGETSLTIQLRRFAKILNIELKDGLPTALYRSVSIGWPMTASGFRLLKLNCHQLQAGGFSTD